MKVRVPIHEPKKSRAAPVRPNSTASEAEESEAFAAFEREFFDPASRYGMREPDYFALERLNEVDRENAITMLLSALTRESRVEVNALCVLKSERAVPALKKLLYEAKGAGRAMKLSSLPGMTLTCCTLFDYSSSLFPIT